MKKIIPQLLFLSIILINNLFAYNPGDYLSPSTLISNQDGTYLYITESTANKIAVFDTKNNQVVKEYLLNHSPSGLALSDDGAELYVTAGSEKGIIYIIDLKNKEIYSQIAVGHTPNSPVVSIDGNYVFVNNQFNNDVSVINLKEKKVEARIPVLREPVASVLSFDGKLLFVANLLPVGPADQYSIASSISVIDINKRNLIKNIYLPNGSNTINGITRSPDGKYIYATHILARYQMPTTQLERGWMNTNALSIIDVQNLEFNNTVLLDEIDLGAANPWDVLCTTNGKYLCISHAGSHEISIIDREALHAKLLKVETGLELAGRILMPEDVKNDLAFLDGFRRRIKLKGLGPRGLTQIDDRLYVAEYFSESIGSVGINDIYGQNIQSFKLGETKPVSLIRRGELLFHDARHCFQQWQSCSSCHPGEARSDALNWDLLNDGVGNPKNSKSLLLAHKTPPAMISGVRDKAESAVRAGIKYIQFASLPDEDAEALDHYLNSLQPVPSPFLIDGILSQSAKRGEKVFATAKCSECHSGPLYTDLQMYDVGTGKGREIGVQFDTPTLIENWRTAPYLHDGRAATVKEIITKFNNDDKHGVTSNLTNKQIDDLIEFVLSQ